MPNLKKNVEGRKARKRIAKLNKKKARRRESVKRRMAA